MNPSVDQPPESVGRGGRDEVGRQVDLGAAFGGGGELLDELGIADRAHEDVDALGGLDQPLEVRPQLGGRREELDRHGIPFAGGNVARVIISLSRGLGSPAIGRVGAFRLSSI